MSSKYKRVGPLGNISKTRDFKQWVLLFSDGDEMTLNRKKYAVMAAKTAMRMGSSIRIYEETVMRTIMANDEISEDSFRIEITEIVKMEIEAENLTIKKLQHYDKE